MGVAEDAGIFTIAQYGEFQDFIKRFSEDDINMKSTAGSGLLHHAIAGRNEDIALFLLEKEIDANMTNSEGQTALHLITFYPNLRIAKELLAKGADINSRDKCGNSSLWSAVFNCKGKLYDIVELFMTYKPDVTTKNKAGRSPLDFAIQVGNDTLINMLQR
jgi:ankyrin repeat protein